MSHLKQRQLTQIERVLDARRQRLLQDIREAAERNGHRHYVELLDGVADSGDESVAAALSDLNALEFHRDIVELRDIAAARKRLEEGSFGVCVECGTEIEFARLAAYPTAKRCIRCQEQYERMFSAVRGRTL